MISRPSSSGLLHAEMSTMIVVCPKCQARYRIDPSRSSRARARVKCPECQHVFDVILTAPPVTEVAPAVTPDESTGSAGEKGQPLVLVVDDARFFREMIRDILAELPIRIETAADGREAWQMIRDLKPALLLLDLNIPGMSGQELIAVIRDEPSCRSLHVLAMSAVQRGDETAHEVRRLGADDFISKSFKPRDLQSRVRQILSL